MSNYYEDETMSDVTVKEIWEHLSTFDTVKKMGIESGRIDLDNGQFLLSWKSWDDLKRQVRELEFKSTTRRLCEAAVAYFDQIKENPSSGQTEWNELTKRTAAYKAQVEKGR